MAKKNKAAVALGRMGGQARAKSMTAKERSAAASAAAQARLAGMTAEERSAQGRRAIQARWSRVDKRTATRVRSK